MGENLKDRNELIQNYLLHVSDVSIKSAAMYWLCNAFELDMTKYPTSHLYFLSMPTSLYASVDTNKIQVKSGIFDLEAFHSQ